jgi:hypothetical protein
VSDDTNNREGSSQRLSRRTTLQGLGTLAAAGVGLGATASWSSASHGDGRGDPSFLQFFHEDWATCWSGLNNSDDWQRATVTTSWPDTELEDYSGSAGNVTTDGSGDVAVEVPPQNWVYYAPANAL